ncbi:hypothetical protein NESM_000402700 [Novymonas esmeraldas]|uniref:Uncharacterized protein n=1 Tax=Novymonas esmeraldas TaxID=1808958 RepID=A0AAW0EME0_9TRYP
MPSVDLLDAFAELVVRVVFSLPHADPDESGSSDEDYDDEMPDGASSTATRIYTRTNSFTDEEEDAEAAQQQQQQQQLQQLQVNMLNDTPLSMSSNSTYLGAGNSTVVVTTATTSSAAAAAAAAATSRSAAISRGSSAVSLDLYPGGIWNAMARVPVSAAAAAAAARAARTAAAAASGSPHRSSSSSSAAAGAGAAASGSNVDCLASPCNGGGLWHRLLGGSSSGAPTPPRTPSLVAWPHTGLTTTASSFVQLTDEELGITGAAAAATATATAAAASAAAGGGGAAHGGGGTMWRVAGVTTGVDHHSSQPQLDWVNDSSRCTANAHSDASTPVREARPPLISLSSSPSSPNMSRQQQQQQQQQLLPSASAHVPAAGGARGLYSGRDALWQSSGGGGVASQRSSSSEFVIL